MKIKIFFLILFSYFLISCSSSPKIERVDPKSQTDLSGRWNDTDSRLVSQEMIRDVLSRPWLNKFTRKKRQEPVVIIATVVNRSQEHINVQTFTRHLERELLNSGKVSFVASSAERGEVRGERIDQELNASEKTRSEMGRETGADFMLKGTINSIVDAIDGKAAVSYQIHLNLINMKNNIKVWIGEKQIKKVIEHSAIRP
ncbi:MAG: penicillin-binding protein activator LpoB [Gammaproteobacteria bacterium]|nr:MAG: penicillin-binding protein activator LpoB [Gammaproteobacteria bacterium]